MLILLLLLLGKGPRIKKRESMVFDHRGGGEGGHQKPNLYSELLFPLNFLCALSFTQFIEKLYIPEGSISPSKSLCTVGVRLRQSYNAVMYLAPMLT